MRQEEARPEIGKGLGEAVGGDAASGKAMMRACGEEKEVGR